MQPKRQLHVPIIRAAVGLLLLWLIRLGVKRLPMLRDLWISELGLTGASVAAIVISLIMIVVLWNFGREFAGELVSAFPGWPQGRVVVSSLVALVALVVAYNALQPVANRVIREDIWAYQVVFIVLTLYPLYRGGIALYGSVDTISQIVTGQMEGAVAKASVCPSCGHRNPQAAEFCTNCGAELTKKAVAQAVPCPNCGTENEPSARFCLSCGASFAEAD